MVGETLAGFASISARKLVHPDSSQLRMAQMGPQVPPVLH
jgi:hypothetical protein